MENINLQIIVHCRNGTDLVSLFSKSDVPVQLENKSTVRMLETSKNLGLGEHADIIKLLVTLPINTTAVVVGNLIFSKLKAKNNDNVTVVIDDTFFDNAQKMSEYIADKVDKQKSS